MRRLVEKRDKGKCKDCKRVFSEWHMDHIQGGLVGRVDELSNLATRCNDCHEAKHNRRPKWGPGRAQALKDFDAIASLASAKEQK